MDASSPLFPALLMKLQCTAAAVATATIATAATAATTATAATATPFTPPAAVMGVPSSILTTAAFLDDSSSDDDDTEQRMIVGAAIADQLLTVGGAMIMAQAGRIRRCWKVPRSEKWWDELVTRMRSDKQWRYYFRMPRALFHRLVGILRPELEKSDTVMRRAIPVEKRVAIAIFTLAHKSNYAVTSALFGTGIATVGEIVVEFALAMEKLLLSRTVYLGNAHQIMDAFGQRGFPQVVGLMDRYHCLVKPPLGQRSAYVNGKGSYSVILQGTCDHTGRFMDVELRWPGSAQDARVARNSVIFEAMEAGIYVEGNPSINIRGQQIGPLILADTAYPIRKWLMKPFKTPCTPKQKLFNKKLNHVREAVEKSFGRLKARWRCLTGPLLVADENVVPILTSCAILHNICETKGRVLDEGLQYGHHFVLPTLGAITADEETAKQEEGEAVRNALADFFQTGRI
ncbi:putative nuclease HARBI1 [Sceloporus undulatus]|uniref:putative nuclease HARBI1 n=1 Tax=Sceloporus undulatus TaxID=8520 RepID=UPI001C4B41C3|nr:putative nuclease HARBI1 [Sceloporus undulatus]